MAERISKHCWATPKCGIMTAKKYFQFNQENVNFQFVIVRNPYRRIVSFYISKVIKHGAIYGADGQIPHIDETDGLLNCTFEELIPHIHSSGERHLKPQSDGAVKYTHFVRLEHWSDDIKLVCDKLNLDYSLYKSVGVNYSRTTDAIAEASVGNKPASWFRENGTPSDYSLFYNNATRAMVHELYKHDFDWLSNVYDDLEIV